MATRCRETGCPRWARSGGFCAQHRRAVMINTDEVRRRANTAFRLGRSRVTVDAEPVLADIMALCDEVDRLRADDSPSRGGDLVRGSNRKDPAMGENDRAEARARVLAQVEAELVETPDGPEGFDVDAIVDEVTDATGGDINGLPPYSFWRIVMAHEKPVELTPEDVAKVDDLLLG